MHETTKLTHQIIVNATAAVDTYIQDIKTLNAKLAEIMKDLQLVDNFSGDASDGYEHFYRNVAVPALDANLIAEKGSLCASLKEMLSSIEHQLLKVVDPEMKNVNMDPSAAGGDGAAAQQ